MDLGSYSTRFNRKAASGKADLKSDPSYVDLSCSGRHTRGPGPDGRKAGFPGHHLHHRRGEGTAILITGHDEIIDDEWGKHQQEDDTSQGEPVHFPGRKDSRWLVGCSSWPATPPARPPSGEGEQIQRPTRWSSLNVAPIRESKARLGTEAY